MQSRQTATFNRVVTSKERHNQAWPGQARALCNKGNLYTQTNPQGIIFSILIANEIPSQAT